MAKYTNPRLVSWKEKGYMEFMKYDEFHNLHETMKQPRDKALLAMLYFTGARAKEVVELKREDIQVISQHILQVKMFTAKRKDKHIRLLDLPLIKPEVQGIWDYLKNFPDGFYIFGWLRATPYPRDYIRKRFGYPAYFFRHNMLSLLAEAGASRELLKEFKGAKNIASVEPYVHLSSVERAKMTRFVLKGIK